MIRVIFLLLLLRAFSFACSASEIDDYSVGSVPKEIYQLMIEKGCSPITGFYDREIIWPAFVYGSGLLDGDTAIFFTCEIDDPKKDDNYKIVLVRKSFSKSGISYSEFGDCPSEIYYRKMPGGLSLRLNKNVKQLNYNLWENTKNYIWDGKKLSFSGIEKSSYWLLEERHAGVGYAFFCANGEWYNVSYD